MIEVVTPPSDEDILSLMPVNRFKIAKRISNTREDAYIQDCILDAWSYIDGTNGLVRRPVLPQVWRFRTASFGQYGWRLPVPHVREIQSISYYDTTNAETVFPPTEWFFRPDMDQLGSTIYWRSGITLPTLYARHDAITVEFACGWEHPIQVPRVFRRALQLVAAHFYDNREESYSDNRITQVPRRIELGTAKILEKWIVLLDYSSGGANGVSG
jgi:uncharacterized phiE125 gp8 family phage protein